MNDLTALELADPRWTDFVAAHSTATAFHHPHWTRLVADCYRYRTFALAVCDAAGVIQAGLPVVEVRHLGGGSRWVSLPYTDYCPPLVSTTNQGEQLVAALRWSSRVAGVRRVEIRAPVAGGPAGRPHGLHHVIALNDDPAKVYAGFHRSQVQRNIKRAEREGLTVRQGSSQKDLLDTFYGLHLRTRRRQGVPVQPRRFFRLLWDYTIATGLGSVLIVESAGQPIAAAVFLTWNGTVIYKFAASDENSWSLRPNHLLIWHAIRTACEQGQRWFDFGRTDIGHDGLRNFKLSWGSAEEPLCYVSLGATPGPAPSSHGSAGRATRVLGTVIRRSPPLLCRAVGEVLYRYVA